MTKEKLDLRAGDKVVIRDDLRVDKLYGESKTQFYRGMAFLRGESVTVTFVYSDGEFDIKEDESKWYWNIDMIDIEKTKQLRNKEQLQNTFTKSDLKSGHVVKLRNGDIFIVMRNEFSRKDYMFNQVTREHMDMSDYDEDMTTPDECGVDMEEFNIDEVYEPLHTYSVKCLGEDGINDTNKNYFKLVWQREERKRMTMLEIEEELGYKIEIIDEGWNVSNENN